MKTLFVFLDESGDMQFGKKGSQHFILSAAYTTDPAKSAAAMQDLKYELLAHGSPDLEFHATANSVGTRKRVAQVISGLNNIKVHTLWIDKGFTHPSKQTEVELFGIFGLAMGRWISKAVTSNHDQIVMVFDSVLTGQKRRAFISKLKPELKSLKITVRMHFHPVKQDLNGQIADYFSWSMYRSLEANDHSQRTALAPVPWTEFHLFQSGHTRYWSR